MELNEAVKIVRNLSLKTDESISIGLTEREALRKVTLSLYRLSRNNEELFDFQGWPFEKVTCGQLMDILKDASEKHEDFKDYSILLMEDDGMGYGAVNGPCNGYDVDDENKEIRLWF